MQVQYMPLSTTHMFLYSTRRGGILLQTDPRLTSVSHMARMYPKDPPWPSEVLETSFGGSQNLRFSGFGGVPKS